MEIRNISGELIFSDDSQSIEEVVINAISSGANLRDANLRGANLREANLSGANLSGANLSEANLSEANLSGADLSGADLSGANLSGANLSGANLSGADLSGADLRRADLSGANLRGAFLSGAFLSEAVGITFAQVSFNWHGEIGRQLSAIKIDGDIVLFCGCFKGSVDDLIEYIEGGDEKYKHSRTVALNTVMSLIKH